MKVEELGRPNNGIPKTPDKSEEKHQPLDSLARLVGDVRMAMMKKDLHQPTDLAANSVLKRLKQENPGVRFKIRYF